MIRALSYSDSGTVPEQFAASKETPMGWADRYIGQLQRGLVVTLRPRGTSMEPRVHDGQQVTLIPRADRRPMVGDVVLCTVHGRQYLHLVKAMENDRYQIGNNRGHINGWTRRVHGVMINPPPAVQGKEQRP
jgi:hypothetical protein